MNTFNFIFLVNVLVNVLASVFVCKLTVARELVSELKLFKHNNNMGKNEADKIVVLIDDVKSQLILFWEGEDLLYVTNHADYHNNNKRLAALKRVAEEMGEQGVVFAFW